MVSISQATGLLVLLAAVGVLPAADPTIPDVLWGTAAGLCGTLGVGLLYRAWHRHHGRRGAHHCRVCRGLSRASDHRPRSAAGADGADRHRPGVVSIALVSQQHRQSQRKLGGRSTRTPAGVPHALVSGVAIGLFFVLRQSPA